MAIPYVKQTWTDGAGGGTPVSAARLAVMEQGIYDAQRMPAARVYNNANISVTTATATALTFNTERFDTDTIHDTGTNTGRLTCKTAGVYQIGGAVLWASATGTYRSTAVRLNGTTIIAEVLGPPASGVGTRQNISTLYQLAVNDYLELIVQHDNATSINVNATGNQSPEFMMVRVST